MPPKPSPFPLDAVDDESGFRVRVDDIGYVGLELRVLDHSGMTLFYSPSQLSRDYDFSVARILAQFVNPKHLDRSVRGQWVLKPNA